MMQKLEQHLFYSGLSGLQLPIPKLQFPTPYQDGSRLSYYASLFNSIEFNSTFYKIPKPETILKWANQVPDNFKFTIKLFKGITHCKYLNFNEDDLNQVFKSINKVQDKKGCLLLQFPPSIDVKSIAKLENLLQSIKNINYTQEWKIAVEFRNKSWYQEQIYEMLDNFNAAMVVHDIPKSATPYMQHTSNFIYLRFHGPTGNYRDSYTDSFLTEYSIYIKKWLAEDKAVYVYFNNTMGDAFKNLQTLNCLIQENIMQ